MRKSTWVLVVVAMLAATLMWTPTAEASDIVFVDETGSVGQESSMQLDGGGSPVIAYLDNVGFADWDLRVAHCGNPSCTSGNVKTTVFTDGENIGPSLALDSGGRPVIAFLSRTAQSEPFTLKLMRCGNANCSQVNVANDVDEALGRPSLVLDGDIPVIAYRDNTGATLAVTRCGNATCSAGNVTSHPVEPTRVSSPSVQVNAQGFPVVGFGATESASVMVLVCGDATCSMDNSVSTVDSDGTLDFHSLVLDENDIPVLTYRDQELRVARCGNTICSSGNTISEAVPFDFNSSRPRESSTGIDSMGRPVIAFYNDSGASVNLLRCGDPTCSSDNSILTVDDSDPVDGLGISMQLGGSGRPVMAYAALGSWGFGVTRLKVSTCANAVCSVPIRCNGLNVTIDMNTNGGDGTGTAGVDVILGTPGPDTIDAGAGPDTVCAGDGNDTVLGGDGGDTIFGGEGSDLVRGGPGQDIIHGEGGNDRLLGGIDGDTITAGDGDDYVGGFGGADTIDGGAGNDRIFGGFGADIIMGGVGADNINGLIGDDTIDGGGGADIVNGDAGNDTVRGGQGPDVVNGGNAVDSVFGDGGDDILGGGKADDSLDGGNGEDVCSGNKHVVGDTAINCETLFGVP